MQPVGEPAAHSHDTPHRRAQHDVHAVAAEPRALVVARSMQAAEDAQARALRRRTAARKQKQQRLVHRCPRPANDDHTYADLVPPATRRFLDVDDRAARGPDARGEDTVIENA